VKSNLAIVVTSISSPNETLRSLASGCASRGYHFVVIGDLASPTNFHLEFCDFFDLKRQVETGFRFAQLCPTKSYARKNIGYLITAKSGATIIRETDDDNIPYEQFWLMPEPMRRVNVIANGGWVNVYRYFSEADIWPRGFPLDLVQLVPQDFESLPRADLHCAIQQGLCDKDPDVDAIYRMVATLPQSFRKDRCVGLSANSWCPFNSQNTTWFRDAFPLMYLPAHCSMRMADIWRSFIAQRIAWTNDWSVLFHEPTVWQKRNDHDLLKDFRDEVPGYLNNRALCSALEGLPLRSGTENIDENLRVCYEAMVSMKLLDKQELVLLEAWIDDLSALKNCFAKQT
jgi:hypothetical protein